MRDGPAAPPLASRPTLSRLINALGTLVAHVAAFAVVIVLAGSAWLSDEPDPELVEIARERIERTLGPGHAIEIGRVSWGIEQGGPALRFFDLAISVPGGAIVEVREAALGLRVSALRGRGGLSLRSIAARHVRVRMSSAGPVSLPPLESVDTALRRGVEEGRKRLLRLGVDRISLSDLAMLPLAADPKRRLNRRWFSLHELEAVRDGLDYALTSSIGLAEGRVPLRGQWNANGLVAESTRAVPALELWAVGSFAADIPLTARLSIPTETTRSAALAVSGGAGPVRIADDLFDVDGLELLASLKDGVVELERIALAAGGNELVATGTLEVTGDRRLGVELSDGRGTLAPGDLDGAPREVALVASGTIDLDQRALRFDEVALDLPDGVIVGTARIGLHGRSPSLAVALAADGLSATAVPALWPSWIAAEARGWVHENVREGTVTSGTLSVDLAEGRLATLPDPLRLTPDEFSVRAELVDASSRLFGDLPPLRDAAGIVAVKGRAIEVALADGTVAPDGLAPVRVTGGRFGIADFSEPGLPARFDIAVAGDARSIATIAEAEPIGAMSQAGLRAGALGGRAWGSVRGEVAIRRPEQRDWEVEMALDRLSVADAIEGRLFSGVDGTLRVTPLIAELRANGIVDGLQAKFNLSEPLGSGTERVRSVELVLDRAGIERIAPGLGAYVGGRTKVTADIGPDAIDVVADLRNTTLDLPWVAWRKANGIAGTARFTLETSGSTTRIRDLTIEGKGFGARGRADVSDAGLDALSLERVALSPGDSFSLALTRRGARFDIDVDGSRFDARGLIRAIDPRHADSTNAADATDVTIRARIDDLRGYRGAALRGAQVTYASRNGSMSKLSLRASMGKRGAIAVDGSGSGGAQSMFVTTDDLGGLLRLMDVYDRLRGGVVTANATRGAGGTWRGFVDGGRMELIDEPKLKLLAGKAGRRSRKLDAKRVYLSRAFSDFTYRDGRLDVSDAILRGPEIGARFDGTVVDARKRIALTGTFLPAYGLNRVFGEVPLLGAFLGNGKEKGLFGLTFRIRGAATEPTIEVNPLSIVAPGILRRIFEYEP